MSNTDIPLSLLVTGYCTRPGRSWIRCWDGTDDGLYLLDPMQMEWINKLKQLPAGNKVEIYSKEHYYCSTMNVPFAWRRNCEQNCDIILFCTLKYKKERFKIGNKVKTRRSWQSPLRKEKDATTTENWWIETYTEVICNETPLSFLFFWRIKFGLSFKYRDDIPLEEATAGTNKSCSSLDSNDDGNIDLMDSEQKELMRDVQWKKLLHQH